MRDLKGIVISVVVITIILVALFLVYWFFIRKKPTVYNQPNENDMPLFDPNSPINPIETPIGIWKQDKGGENLVLLKLANTDRHIFVSSDYKRPIHISIIANDKITNIDNDYVGILRGDKIYWQDRTIFSYVEPIKSVPLSTPDISGIWNFVDPVGNKGPLSLKRIDGLDGYYVHLTPNEKFMMAIWKVTGTSVTNLTNPDVGELNNNSIKWTSGFQCQK